MGDRCFVSITCRTEDTERLTAAVDDGPFGQPEGETPDDGTTVLEWIEVNYAGGIQPGDHGSLPIDIAYYGHHDAGGDYGEGVFACDGHGEFVYCYSHDGQPVALTGDDGKPMACDIESAKRYWAIVELIEKAPQPA